MVKERACGDHGEVEVESAKAEWELDEGDPSAVVHGAWVGEEVMASARRSGFKDEMEA